MEQVWEVSYARVFFDGLNKLFHTVSRSIIQDFLTQAYKFLYNMRIFKNSQKNKPCCQALEKLFC